MFDPYKRLLSVILWGIGLVNYVQLTSTPGNEINLVLYVLINIVLLSSLISVIIKKYYAIKFLKLVSINVGLTIPIIGAFDYLIIKDLYNNIALYNQFGTIIIFFVLILLNISLFLEITD